MTRTGWTNWGGNQAFYAAQAARPESEDEAISIIRDALNAGLRVRTSGGGHSFTPVVETDGLLLDLSNLSGIVGADSDSKRATVYAGSRIADLGEPLWAQGLSIANQGDIDVQTIAGATATGTKGSGLRFGSLSSAITSMRIINGKGDIVDIDETDIEALLAAQVSLGMLGPVLRIGLQLVPAYGLKEENIILPMSEVLAQWDFLLEEYRHFSFWWMPTDQSAHLYKLGDVPADHCFVKLLREVPLNDTDIITDTPNRRTDRAYRIYPDGTTIAEFHELEYMVDASDARDAVATMQSLMRTKFPHEISPLQVRWQKGDRGFLSPQSGRDTTSISVSGVIGKDYLPFLKAVDKELQVFSARPHWGKLHFLDRDRVRTLYPDYDRFEKVRARMDPDKRFLNPHLADLFG